LTKFLVELLSCLLCQILRCSIQILSNVLCGEIFLHDMLSRFLLKLLPGGIHLFLKGRRNRINGLAAIVVGINTEKNATMIRNQIFITLITFVIQEFWIVISC